MLGIQPLVLTALIDFAKSAVAVLVAVLAIYLAMRLLGKIAKFIVTIVVVVALIWFLSSSGILGQIISTVKSASLDIFPRF